jgi:hypothetical protein
LPGKLLRYCYCFMTVLWDSISDSAIVRPGNLSKISCFSMGLAVDHALISALVRLQPMHQPKRSSMRQMDLQGESKMRGFGAGNSHPFEEVCPLHIGRWRLWEKGVS